MCYEQTHDTSFQKLDLTVGQKLGTMNVKSLDIHCVQFYSSLKLRGPNALYRQW